MTVWPMTQAATPAPAGRSPAGRRRTFRPCRCSSAPTPGGLKAATPLWRTRTAAISYNTAADASPGAQIVRLRIYFRGKVRGPAHMADPPTRWP